MRRSSLRQLWPTRGRSCRIETRQPSYTAPMRRAALATGTAAPALASAPSRSLAQRYAHRTYIVQPQLGRRVYHLDTPRLSFTAADGSTISAWGAVLNSGDGTGEIVVLFRNLKFLGWA